MSTKEHKVDAAAVKKMMEAAMHFGHQTQRWNPKMRRYLYGSKNGIHVFDLDKTALYLDRAAEYVKQLVSSGKVVMFASTKPQAANLIAEAANEVNMPYVINKWMPGLLTNFSTIKRRVKYFNKLRKEEKEGEFDKYTKKEAVKLRKELVKLEDAFGGVKDMEKLPDAIFITDVVRDKLLVKEANKIKIPVIAIVDSNADPTGVDYEIPANDDAIASIGYVIDTMKNAIKESKGKKK